MFASILAPAEKRDQNPFRVMRIPIDFMNAVGNSAPTIAKTKSFSISIGSVNFTTVGSGCCRAAVGVSAARPCVRLPNNAVSRVKKPDRSGRAG
jgi:hypothetical protein